MNSRTSLGPRAILFRLGGSLEAELSEALSTTSCQVQSALAPIPSTGQEIVFCCAGADFPVARSTFPQSPLVVVSRLPDTGEWLDALEGGAVDYCAAPFESIQMKWLLEKHIPQHFTAVA